MGNPDRAKRRRGGLERPLRVTAAVAVLVLTSSLTAPFASAQTPSDILADVPTDAYYSQAVQSLHREGVFDGTACEAGFCPDGAMDRKTMAVWLVRTIDSTDPTPSTGSRFRDVTANSFWSPFIERLAELEITVGCGDGTNFCPDHTVTRAQMAVFLSRAYSLPDAPDPGFFDVPAAAWYRGDVARLAAARISVGCGDGTNFCPDHTVTRAQMAAFLARATGSVTSTNGDSPSALVSFTVPSTMAGFWALPSPDGKHVAYHASVPGGYAITSLYVASQDGTGLTLLSRFAFGDRECRQGNLVGRCGNRPVKWSPDSTQLLYHAFDPENSHEVLYAAQADGASQARLAEGPIVRHRVIWAPDSTRVSYVVLTVESTGPRSARIVGRSLYAVGVDGTDRAWLGEDPIDVAWAPDSTRIAYTLAGGLFVIEPDGSNRTPLASAQGSFTWSPDSTRIAYTLAGGLFATDTDGFRRTRLGHAVSSAAWAPDGARIAYTTATGALRVAEADGSAAIRLIDNNVSHFGWSPDGARIAYTTTTGALRVAEADGSGTKSIDDTVRRDESGKPAFVWSPEGRRLAYLDVIDPDDSVAFVVVTAAQGERSVIGTAAARIYRCMLIDLHWTAAGITADARMPPYNEPLPTCSP